MILHGLKTERNKWTCDVTLFKNVEEAKKAGYGLMYEDKEGQVYGIAGQSQGHWDSIAFVPKENLYDKYVAMAENIGLESKISEAIDRANALSRKMQEKATALKEFIVTLSDKDTPSYDKLQKLLTITTEETDKDMIKAAIDTFVDPIKDIIDDRYCISPSRGEVSVPLSSRGTSLIISKDSPLVLYPPAYITKDYLDYFKNDLYPRLKQLDSNLKIDHLKTDETKYIHELLDPSDWADSILNEQEEFEIDDDREDDY